MDKTTTLGQLVQRVEELAISRSRHADEIRTLRPKAERADHYQTRANILEADLKQARAKVFEWEQWRKDFAAMLKASRSRTAAKLPVPQFPDLFDDIPF